jgi:hypothetical protein
MASGNFSSSSVNGLSLYVEWVSVPNTSTNTSQVTATLYVKSYSLRASVLADSYLIINGNKVGWSTTSLNVSSTSSIKATQVATHSVQVSHGSDGKKSITIKANFEFNGTYGGTYVSDLTASKTIELDTIPRSSTLSVPASVNTGTNLTASITPSSSSFRHKIELCIDGTQKHMSDYIAAGTKSYAYKIPHSWLPKTTSTTMTVYLYTYTASGTSPIAKTSKPVTVNVPSNIKPSVSKLAASVSNGLGGEYIQGKSAVKLTATATPGDGSTITSYIFKGANINETASTYTGTNKTKTSSTIQTSGEVTYKVQAKDARGRLSAEKEVTITVHTYAAPQITSISARRCLKDGTLNRDGTYAKVTVKTSYAALNGANTRLVRLYNSGDNFAAGTLVLNANSTDDSYTGVYGGSFAVSQSYTIKAVITDAYNTGSNLSKATTIETAERTLNIAKHGNGICVGGLSSVVNKSDTSKFECNWDAYFNDSLFVTNKITCTNPYNARDFNINCQWKDGQNHDILVRSIDGLTMGLGWVGNSTYPTVLDIRPTKVNVRGATHFQCTTDTAPNAQNDVPVRIGNANGSHIDIDGNEIMAKASPTTLNSLAVTADATNFYVGDVITFKTGHDETSEFIRSAPTYERTYNSSPNVYITSSGTFGRSSSSSKRYKTDICDVKDAALNPYRVLDIPVRQYKYNSENIPVGKDADDMYIGIIAEEAASAFPAAAEYNEDGEVEMWNIKVIVPAMLKIIQDQQKEIKDLKEQIKLQH